LREGERNSLASKKNAKKLRLPAAGGGKKKGVIICAEFMAGKKEKNERKRRCHLGILEGEELGKKKVSFPAHDQKRLRKQKEEWCDPSAGGGKEKEKRKRMDRAFREGEKEGKNLLPAPFFKHPREKKKKGRGSLAPPPINSRDEKGERRASTPSASRKKILLVSGLEATSKKEGRPKKKERRLEQPSKEKEKCEWQIRFAAHRGERRKKERPASYVHFRGRSFSSRKKKKGNGSRS